MFKEIRFTKQIVGKKIKKSVSNAKKTGGSVMKDVNVEIVGQKAKTFYEFIVAHNSASDGQRLGQRFVNIFISQPWPKLFYEQSDKEAMKTIEKWLTDHHYYPKMPPLRKQK